MQHLTIFKKKIAAGALETITTRTDVAVTLWVEKGKVEILTKLDGTPIARAESVGAVMLGPHEVHLHNRGKKPAVVFIAIADAPLHRQSSTRLLEAVDEALPMTRFNVLCDTAGHGVINKDGPLSRGDAEDLQRDHIALSNVCANRTRIRPA